MKHLLIAFFSLTIFSASAQPLLPVSNSLKSESVVASAGKLFASSIVYTVQSAAERLSPVSMATELCTQLQFKYAQLMDREVESVTNISLFSFIEDWWGTKYRYGGTTKKGIDCSSFTGTLMQSVFHFSLPRTAAQQYAFCTKLNRDEMAEGDLVFFNTRGGISHVGVYLGDDYFVHSSCNAGVTISSLKDGYYAKRFKGAGRVPGENIVPEVSDYL